MLRCGFGLKDAPRLWQKVLDKCLRDLGYRAMQVDPQLYVLFQKGDMVMILSCHVDGIKGPPSPRRRSS